MDCTIKHESLGRLRIHLHQCYMTLPEADQVEYWIKELAGVNRVKVYDRTADATILYDGKTDTRQRIIDCLSSFDYKTCKPKVAEHTGREIQRYYEDKMFDHIAARIITRWFLPVPIRSSIRLIKAVPFVLHGLKSLSKGKLDVHVSVHKSEGAPVFAGTVMDEGQLVIQVTKVSGSGQYDRRFRKIKIKYRNTNIQSCRSLISGNICGNSSDLSVHTKCDPCLLDHDG